MLAESGSLLQLGSKGEAHSFWDVHSVRFEMAMLIAGAMTVFSIVRGSLSMALVCMVEESSPSSSTSSPWNVSLPPVEHDPWKVDWEVVQQARIHTAFYIGAFISVVLTDPMTRIFGAKNLMSLGLLLNAVGTIGTPPAVLFIRHYIAVVLIRVLVGFGYGFCIPCGSVIIAKWFPITEKSTAMAVFTVGIQIGLSLSMVITAKTCKIPLIGGWPFSFFCYGFLSLAFLLIWHIRASNKPRESKYITATELEHIMGRRARRRTNTLVMPTPYSKILLSPCVIAICACSFVQSFVLVALISYLPKFNQSAMNMSLSANGFLSALPFFLQMGTKLMFGTAADAIKQKKVSATLVTKIFNGVASFGTAGCLIVVALLGASHPVLVTLFITISMGLFSGYVPGYNTSIVSVAPQFTAFISSYAQIYSQVASALAPIPLGLIITNGTAAEWQTMFFVLSATLVVSGLIFQFMGHGRTESWGESPSRAPSVNNLPDRPPSQLNLEEINARLEAEPRPRSNRARKVSYRDSKRDESQSHLSTVLEDDVIEDETFTENDADDEKEDQ